MAGGLIRPGPDGRKRHALAHRQKSPVCRILPRLFAVMISRYSSLSSS